MGHRPHGSAASLPEPIMIGRRPCRLESLTICSRFKPVPSGFDPSTPWNAGARNGIANGRR